jgi:glycine/D-amino acid oxidase-like deaminating enzyme
MAELAPDEAVIVGASLNGLCAAYELLRRGVERITILEQYRVGHVKGASHGRARLASRLGFEEPMLTLAHYALVEYWPALQAELGRAVLKPAGGLAVGELGPGYRRRAQAEIALAADVTSVELAEARRRWPMLRLDGDIGVLRDDSAMLIAAEAAYDALLASLQKRGVRVLTNTRVESIHSTADGLWIETDRGRRVTDRLIATVGGWAPSLLERTEPHLGWRREVAVFFGLGIPEADWKFGKFPAVRFMDEAHGVSWSVLPEFADRGVKVARHVDDGRPEALREAVASVTAWFEKKFSVPVAQVLGTEVRQVSKSADHPCVIDTHHDDPRIVFACGFDGHETHFAPLVGRLLADLSLDGKSGIPAFQTQRKAFALPRRGVNPEPRRRGGG